MSGSSIFLLGAAGYIAGQLLVSLAAEYPSFAIRALDKDLSPSKVKQLQSFHPKLEVIEGYLADVNMIEAEAKKADIVINVSLVSDMDSINAILRGLKQRGSSGSLSTPIYIHMMGTGLLGDDAFGEFFAPRHIWKSTSKAIGLGSNACELIVEASKTGFVRTMIALPGLIYGVGPGLQRVSLPQRVFLNLASLTGHVGTFGPGRNVMNFVHLKDVASAMLAMLNGALEGKNMSEGENGFYFIASKYMISISDLGTIMGDVNAFQPRAYLKSQADPILTQVVEKVGPLEHASVRIVASAIMSSNQFCRAERLAKEFGWSPRYTESESFFESIPREVEVCVKDLGLEAAFKDAKARSM
ncbi:hypothetical protein BDP27DRAFT_1450643 [Rhodocollybia butyracea]|uniref:Uncharacterized protein n=1 Tax=Rhodocollybia butyracea TaxID=206335 RepID=A0A9P5PK04_9AGAR|nr:hypothetical protein BDP27DRAFT_1450643 [Rhodocollybia butyracea]